jgi:uncharacterized protein
MNGKITACSFTRVLTAPAAGDDAEAPLRRAIVAGLLDAGVQDRTVAAAWIRPAAGAPLHVLIADGLESGAAEREAGHPVTPLLFPLGATGRAVQPAELSQLLAPFTSWIACGGGFEPLLADTDDQSRALDQRWSAAPFDDVVGYLSHQPFAWVVACTPVPGRSVQDELDNLRRELFRLHQAGRLSELDSLRLERGQAWFRELSRAGTGGVWDVAIAVGSPDDGKVRSLAAILATAAERSTASYRIRPLRGDPKRSADGAFAAAADAAAADGAPADDAAGESGGGDRAPFRATTELAASLIRPPETELPGVRAVAAPSFDTTPESDDGQPGRVELGTVLDRFLRPAGTLAVSPDTLNRHVFVCGATGGGKSQTVRALLEALSRRSPPVPWMVIEPAKAEYAAMAGRLADLPGCDVLAIRPGDPGAVPVSVNPLQPASLDPGDPARGFPLQSHADLVRALFLAAFHADDPFPQVLSRALTRCYEAAGWDLVTSEPMRTWARATGQPTPEGSDRSLPRYPTLGDLEGAALRVVDEIGYGDDIKKNVRGFVDVRIASLRLGTPGRLFEGGHPLDFAELLRRNVVVEIEGVTNDQDKAFVMGALLIRLYEQLLLESKHRRADPAPGQPLRHLTVIEEAHRLLRNVPPDSPAAHSLELFASLLAEVRAYGEGIVVAEQIPSKLIPDVIKNTALKIVHRLPADDDRHAVGATMNLSDAQSEYVVTLTPGTAAVFADGMDRPVLAHLPDGTARESASGQPGALPLLADGRRSRSCGRACEAGSPCTLSSMRHAQRFLDSHPELTLWMEMSVAAHGIGVPAPTLADTPATGHLKAAMKSEPRLVECAIAHAAEAALATRYHRLAGFFDPDALARHLTQVLTGILTGDGAYPGCGQDAGRWRFGHQRYHDIRSGLLSRPGRAQHEALIAKARDRGLALEGDSPTEDYFAVEWLPANRIGAEEMRLMMFGEQTPALAVSASTQLAGRGEPENRTRKAVGDLLLWEKPAHKSSVLDQLFPKTASAPRREVIA